MHIFYNDTFDFRIAIKVNDFHQACDILRIYLKGKIDLWYSDSNIYEYYIDYGLNRFYVEENTGKELENQSARGELALVLKVADGYALIEDIIVPRK